MGFIDTFLNKMKFDEDSYEDDFEDDEEEEIVPRRRFRDSAEEDEGYSRSRRSKITQMPKKSRDGSYSRGKGVMVVKPTKVDDAMVVIDTLLENRTVVVNMEGIPTGMAQRILDMVMGANAALEGHFEQISKSIFIVTPSSVDISGDFNGMGSADPIDMFGMAK
ncbi:MAG: cell division protein SepF [Lachnospiraceae bacterium]|nr:cell division protein SepF [Lachnospiraceae bacterium]